jgi:single-stranded-DNA-specific exonuclease
MCDVPQDAAARGRPSLADRVIAARGLGGEPRAESILRSPRLSLLHPPAELPGADAVAQRLVSAVREGRPLAIYGDYDADGVTATAVLWHVLRAASADAPIETYTPSRLEEGYGLHASVLRQMHARGVRTVVSVDCGITAHAAAEAACEIGLELLITDHHAPECDDQGVPRLPCAAAIAHPSLPGARAPFADICGAAVAFKVASRFAYHWCGGERVPRVFQEALARTVPLVALGTVADVVPLVDENRIFAAAGLAAIHGSGIEGLRALLFHSDIAGGTQVHSEDVAFRLAPRLNAIGRLGHAAQAVELLTTADPARARAIAAELGRRNDERRAIEQRIADEACRMAEAEGMTRSGSHVIALAHPEWHEGVVGVVCSKLVERFGRPAVLCCLRGDGSAKGSGRSVDGFDLVGAVRACAQHLDSCGGHAAAVGLTVRAGAWQAFREALESCCAAELAQRDLVPELRYDAEAWLDELSIASLRSLDPLRPFGRGHVEPTFLLRGLRVQAVPQVFGSARTHLQLHLASRQGRGAPVRAVWWGGARHVGALSRAVELDVVARARVDAWQGRERVQLDLGDAGVTA